jgi:hypothetical protein
MDQPTKFNRDGLAQKIRWEGGLLAALDYGIKARDIADPELAALWRRLERAYARMAPLLDQAADELGVAA